MKKYVINRLLQIIPILIGVSIIIFLLVRIVPGSPAVTELNASGVAPTPQAVADMEKQLGLQKPIVFQYFDWMKGVVKFDFGTSYKTGTPVTKELLSKFPATIYLAFGGLAICILLAIPLGVLAGIYKDSFIDKFSMFVAMISSSVPGFLIGFLLIYTFAVKLNLQPVVTEGKIKYMLLPAFTLGISMSSSFIRLTRTSVLEVLNQEYILAARARGVKERFIIFSALKQALIPVITSGAISFGHLLGGTAIIESVFSWPGLGKYCLDSITARDYPVIQGYVIFMTLIFVFVNFLVDIVYMFLNPQIRME